MNDVMKNSVYLKAESIYRFLSGMDDKLDTLIMCETKRSLLTTDQSLYEAIGAFKDRKEIDLNRLVKLLEVTQIESFERAMNRPRTILREERVAEIIEMSKED